MQQAICKRCGEQFSRPDTRQTYCTKACQKAGERERYRAKLVPMACAHCEREFMGHRWDKADAHHQRRYCSADCDRLARSARLKAQGTTPPGRMSACPHGTNSIRSCPACTFIGRATANRKLTTTAFKRAMRRDPCCYCGDEGQALDHIDPRQRGGSDDWDNRTSSCHRCNSMKTTLPLLQALPWIPIASEYHNMRRELFAA